MVIYKLLLPHNIFYMNKVVFHSHKLSYTTTQVFFVIGSQPKIQNYTFCSQGATFNNDLQRIYQYNNMKFEKYW